MVSVILNQFCIEKLASSPGHSQFFNACTCNIEKWVWPGDEAIEKSRCEREPCPPRMSGIEKRPPLGGYVSIKVMLDTIRNTMLVRYREAVLFSEAQGPLSEARLTVYILLLTVSYIVLTSSYDYC